MDTTLQENIYIILINPQMGENIGACARVMLNFNLTNLRIVNPRDGWPNEKALAMASGAKKVINNAEIFGEIEEAVSDLNIVYATTKRSRDINKPYYSPKEFSSQALDIISSGHKVGILFGPEKSGLTNYDLSFAKSIITIDTNPEYGSLNLAQSCGIIAYEIKEQLIAQKKIENHIFELASSKEINYFLNHLNKKLEEKDFFTVREKKDQMQIKIRNLFNRIDNFTSSDVKILMGIINCLTDD